MIEEEKKAIKILKDKLEKGKELETRNNPMSDIVNEIIIENRAIESLLQRNKELEESNHNLLLIVENSILKSKIKEKIEFIKSLKEKIYYEENVISILKDLLGE